MIEALRNLCLAAAWAAACAAPAAASESAPSDTACDLSRGWDVQWAATGETVRLGLVLSTAEGDLPRGALSLTLSDGRVVDLGTGGKYIDDGEWSCADVERVASQQTLDSLAPSEAASDFTIRYRRMADLAAALDGYAPCPAEGSCDGNWSQAMEEGWLWREANRATYDALLATHAPLVTVRRSTYYSETLAIDLASGTTVTLFAEGC